MKNTKYFKDVDNLKIIGNIIVNESQKKIHILITESYSQKLIRYIHEELCHLVSKRQVDYLQESYYWPNMSQFIEYEIQKCAIYAKRKTYTGRTKELMIPRKEFGPLEQIIVNVTYFAEFWQSSSIY